MKRKRGLGRGLSELGLNEVLSSVAKSVETSVVESEGLRELQTNHMQPSPYQPRKIIDQEALRELAQSIRSQGVIQPIVVREVDDNRYEIIAGERRWRAAQLAGLVKVPVVIKNISEQAAIAVALIENIQRQDLNAIEESQALNRLMTEFVLTHQQVADMVGKSRASVTNLLRLLKLNDDVRQMLEQGQLEMGHARALLSLEGVQQSDIADRVLQRKLSVRETEQLVRFIQQRASGQATDRCPAVSSELLECQRKVAAKLNAKVKIRQQPDGRGRIVINYKNDGELQKILERL
ncbi:MAG: chromosome partitioning protein ParB [Gammaproteobacteria bacterium RIFCSPHIGHO2_12_FULL_41_15]|nr:MAG: chromosome partitioning protein ParB [Gammaproteobacteria bacterium RIFCSPHIGHO2_12_FULL_41_15]